MSNTDIQRVTTNEDEMLDIESYNPVMRSFWHYLVSTSPKLPGHWSPARDLALRQEVYKNEFLGSLINTVQYKLLGIPFSIQSKDTFVGSHLKLATIYNDVLQSALYGDDTMEKFIFDVLTCDNGGFLYIFNEDDPADQPLSSMPTNLIHLDSVFVQRTGKYNFPVLYQHTNNLWYPIHRSRIINITQMPSPDRELLGVGYSNVSRLFKLSDHLLALSEYEDEIISGFDAESVLYATGARSDELESAFKKAEVASLNEGRRKVGKRVYLGIKSEQGKIGKFNLKELPANFNKRDDIEVTLTLASLASGGNPDWFYSAIRSGSTKASSQTAEKIAEAKVIAWWMLKVAQQFQYKFCPESLKIVVGSQEDIDGTTSRVQLNNSMKRQNNIASGVTNIRTERELLVASGELSQIQFENLELQDGRLENGLPIESIFSTNETSMKKLIYFIDNPLDFENNQYEEIKDKLVAAIKYAESLSLNGNTIQTQRYGRQALYALKWVLDKYEKQQNQLIETPNIQINPQDNTSYQDELQNLNSSDTTTTNISDPSQTNNNNNDSNNNDSNNNDSNNNNDNNDVNKSFTTNRAREIRKEFRRVFKEYAFKSKDLGNLIKSVNKLFEKYFNEKIEQQEYEYALEKERLSDLYKLVDEIIMDYI